MRRQNQQAMTQRDAPFVDAATSPSEVVQYLNKSKASIERASQAGILQIPLAGHLLRMVWWILPHSTQQESEPYTLAFPPEASSLFVRDALEHYHITAHLAASGLHQYLNFESHRDERDVSTLTDGFALRRALDQVLDATCNFAPTAAKTLRNEQYLDLHYRKLIDDKELSKRYHFSTRHLRRIRDEQIAIATEMLLRFNPAR